MLHDWFGRQLAQLGCILVAWGVALQERYHRYLPHRNQDEYITTMVATALGDPKRKDVYTNDYLDQAPPTLTIDR